MAEDIPIFRSPIIVPPSVPQISGSSSDLRLSDLTGVPVILIQGQAGDVLRKQWATIPAKPGDLVDVGDGLLARLTPAEFYLFGKSVAAKLPSAAELDDSFAKARLFAHATDFTHGKAILRLVGAAAPEMLPKICGLDFHDTVFPNMHVAQTSAAKIKTLIARYDESDAPAYFLHVDRPYGQYFWEVVWDAGREIQPWTTITD